MEETGEKRNITIAEIAKRAGVSSATASYVISGRRDVKISDQTRERVLALCRELGYRKGAPRKSSLKKQVTIDDIAREAGVSTATVSYIVNDRKDVKISDETRRKVLQICNLRQYTPSSVARLLAGKKNKLIGIYTPQSPFPVKNAEYYALLTDLQDTLRRADYGTMLFSPTEIRDMRMHENVEGIVCIDLTEEEFYCLKERCFVPIVAVGMIVSDPLFFKVYTDHRAVMAAAKAALQVSAITYVTYPYRNRPYLDDLSRAMQQDTLFLAEDLDALREYVRLHPHDAFLFADELLAELCTPFAQTQRRAVLTRSAAHVPSGALTLSLPSAADRAVEMLQSAIRREESKPHTFLLSPLAP